LGKDAKADEHPKKPGGGRTTWKGGSRQRGESRKKRAGAIVGKRTRNQRRLNQREKEEVAKEEGSGKSKKTTERGMRERRKPGEWS